MDHLLIFIFFYLHISAVNLTSLIDSILKGGLSFDVEKLVLFHRRDKVETKMRRSH